jgi:hypothetical protein
MALRHDYFASLNLSAAIPCSSQTPDGFEAGLPLQPTGAERPVRSGRRSISNLWGVQLVAKKEDKIQSAQSSKVKGRRAWSWDFWPVHGTSEYASSFCRIFSSAFLWIDVYPACERPIYGAAKLPVFGRC